MRGKTYEDLPTELKRQLNKGQLAVTIYQNCEQGDLPTLVNIYNNHIAMNASQKALTYVGNFAKEIRKIKTNDFKLFSNYIYENKLAKVPKYDEKNKKYQ